MKTNRGVVHLFLLVIVIFVAIGAIGYLAYQNAQLKKQTEETTTAPETINQQVSKPNGSATANWKSYISVKAQYTFKHPQEWPLENIMPASNCEVCVENLVFTPSYDPNSADSTIAVILVFKDDRVKTLDDYIKLFVEGSSSKTDIKNATLGGEEAISYKLTGGIPPLPIVQYAVVKDGFYYELRLEDSSETNKNRERNIKIFNQILSTFKFTDQDSAKPTGSTCKSVNLGMSVTMPNQNWECSVDNLGKEQKGWDGTITAKSSTFDVVISSLGRGPSCSSLSESCVREPFYSNSNVSLELYRFNGENKEIFGPTVNNRALVSIKWSGMQQRALTTSERAEIITLLDSISLE